MWGSHVFGSHPLACTVPWHGHDEVGQSNQGEVMGLCSNPSWPSDLG